MLKKKINRLIIGTNNQGKVREIKKLLPKNIEIDIPKNLNLASPKENGSTFFRELTNKSQIFLKKTKSICLADDSGLEIDILKKLPGIYSARWAGKSLILI